MLSQCFYFSLTFALRSFILVIELSLYLIGRSNVCESFDSTMSAVAAGMESDTDSDCEIVFSSKIRESSDIRTNSSEHSSQKTGLSCTGSEMPVTKSDRYSSSEIIFSSTCPEIPVAKQDEKEFEKAVTTSPPPTYVRRMKRNTNATYHQRALKNEAVVFDDLRYAVLQGNLTSTKNLYETSGIHTDTILKSGWTGLMYACSVGHSDIVEYLLQRKANPNYHMDMFTPLMAVCISKKYEENLLKCCSLLLTYGATVNVHDRHFVTPLMFAAREGHAQIVKLLLESGAHPNATDNRGYTALAWAAFFGHGQVVRILLENGADKRRVNNMGQLPTDIAYDKGHTEVASLLQNMHSLGNEQSEKSLKLPAADDSEKRILPVNSSTFGNPENSKKFVKHGELEVFLFGIGCQDLVDIFTKHHLNFHDVVIMSDDELEKIGIFQAGLRKKILEASKDVHKKEWQNSSLPNLRKNQFISCPDAVSMIANISKHLKYISTSVVYIRQQIQSEPRILELSKDSANVHNLMDEIEDSIKNLHSLKDEMRFLKLHIIKIQDKPEFSSGDLILENTKSKSRQKIYVAIGIAAISIIMAGVCYKHPVQSSLYIRIPFLT